MNIENFISEQHAAVQAGQVMMILFPVVLLIIVGLLICVAVKTVRIGRLPHALEVLRDVRQPIRNHRHYHYSARAMSTEEVNEYDVISLNQ